MGEINSASSDRSSSKHTSKKLSTRVDLTPMVDLGFLLITFFIFTTSMSQPKAMKLNLPDDKPVNKPMQAPEEKTINIIIDDDNHLIYYPGSSINLISILSASAIRSTIIQKKKEMAIRYGKGSELIVLIKPTKEASYENIVKILDEMTINQVTRYVMMEPDAKEKNEIARFKIK